MGVKSCNMSVMVNEKLKKLKTNIGWNGWSHKIILRFHFDTGEPSRSDSTLFILFFGINQNLILHLQCRENDILKICYCSSLIHFTLFFNGMIFIDLGFLIPLKYCLPSKK